MRTKTDNEICKIREREVRDETPSPNPQVSGGLGLGYMATSHACLNFMCFETQDLLAKKSTLETESRECHDVLS